MRGEYYLFAVIVILTIGIIVLIDLQTSPGFSEVYFDNSTVPAYLTPNTTYNVVFIIESHENDPEEYFFKIYLDNVAIKGGKVLLKPKSMVQIPFEFSVNNVAYKEVMLWKQTTTYNLSGIYDIIGSCMGDKDILAINVSCTSETLKCLPPLYAGPSNLSFLMNTSKNTTLVKIVEDKSNTSRVVSEYKLTLIKTGRDKYRAIVRESKIMYLPKPITIKIIVETSDGKVYQIFRRLPIMEG